MDFIARGLLQLLLAKVGLYVPSTTALVQHLHHVRKKSLQFSLNNFNKCLQFLPHIIRIQYTLHKSIE